MKNKFLLNKKASDIPSILFAIASIFTIGIILVVFSNLFLSIYESLQTTINSIPNINASIANETLTTVIGFEQSMWDYFFLAVLIGYVITMMVLAFSTQAQPFFYVIFIIVAGISMFIGVALSNTWEAFAETEALSGTIARFPITDAILNNFFPLFIAIMFVLIMIMLFGKRFLGESSGGIR